MLWEHERYDGGRRAVKIRKQRQHRRRIHRIKQLTFCMAMICMVCIGIAAIARIGKTDAVHVTEEASEDIQRKGAEPIEAEVQKIEVDSDTKEVSDTREVSYAGIGKSEEDLEKLEECPEELQELLEKYPETYDFVMGYSDRDKYVGKEIDLTEEVQEGEVPLLLQWDKRWGYDNYGDKLIGVAGCGPTCMSMAYIYLTGETEMNPRKMAEFANKNGYNSEAGTKWDFFTDGAVTLGLKGSEMKLSEEGMKAALDSGNVIICSMRPGDFTKGGHFILIRGYDREGFLVNDPNSRKNSEKHWEFDTLRYQIKCLWSIGA